MKIKEIVEKQRDKAHVIYNITVDRADAKKLFEEAKESMASNVGVKAVPGKDVYPELAQRFTTKEIETYISDYMTGRVTPIIITQNRIPVAMEPTCHLYSKADGSEDLVFRATMTLKPEFKLTSYAPVSVTVPSPKVTKAEVDEQFAQIQKMTTKFEPISEDRGVQDSDVIDLDIKTFSAVNNEEIPHLSGEDRLIDLSQDTTPQAFKEQIRGMKPGETRDFSYENPEMAGSGASDDLSSKVNTTVKLNRIGKAVLPDINDAWVKENVKETDTVEGFRTLIEKDITLQKEQYCEDAKNNAVDEELASRLVGTIPDDIFEWSAADMERMMESQLREQNMTKEDFFKQNNMNEEQWHMQAMMEVRSMLRSGYALDALAEELKIESTPELVKQVAESMAPGNADELLANFQRSSRMYVVDEVARRYGAHQWLIENANYEYTEE